MKPNHYIFLYLLQLFYLPLFTACSNDEEHQSSDVPIVTVMYAINGLGDEGYNDVAAYTIYQLRDSLGFRLHTLSPESMVDAERMLQEWITSHKERKGRQLLYLAADTYEYFVRKYASQLPDDNHACVILSESAAEDTPAHTFRLAMYGLCYEAGQMAGMILSETPIKHEDGIPRVLTLMAEPNSEVLNEAEQGFRDGLHDNCGISPDTLFLANDESGYYQRGTVFSLANSINESYNFVYPLCGGSVQGLIDYYRNCHTADKEVEFMIAGMDVDMSVNIAIPPFSSVKHHDVVIRKYLKDWINGLTLPRHETFGLESGITENVISPLYSLFYTIPENFHPQLKQVHTVAIRKEKEYEHK